MLGAEDVNAAPPEPLRRKPPGTYEDGSSKTREMKLVATWTADSHDKAGVPMRDEGSVTYNATIESAATADTDEQLSDFAQRVEREACRTGFDAAQRQVMIGDGAKWIWSLADELFPRAIQIVDLYHAKGTVSETAKKIVGPESQMSEEKGKQWRDLLEAGDIDRIIDDLGAYTSCQDATTFRHRYSTWKCFFFPTSREKYSQKIQ